MPRSLFLGGEDGLPFSKGLLARSLMATGVRAVDAYELARRAELDLLGRGEAEVDLDRLQDLAVDVLGERGGLAAVRRLRALRELQGLAVPVVILIGGGTGTGKSTVATEVAHRLGITRVTSTDFIRQTMRAFFSKEFMPSIHYSSFDAELALTKAEEEESGDAALLGFLDQARNVLVGAEAAVDRAVSEGWSMVLEGIHLVPGLLAAERGDALVVQCVLAIHDEELHRGHFLYRDASSGGERPYGRYLDRFTEIRSIQGYIVERARRADVPVIENTFMDQAVADVMELVLAGAERAHALP